jgi:2-dehydro-3-deoxyphosphogluconate aldolase / (4S)-4-hydroxy-2-oxoglutarate aldolase
MTSARNQRTRPLADLADFVNRLTAARLVPILRLTSEAAAADAARWLIEAGLPIIELTLTTPGTMALVKALRAELGGNANRPLIGVGTILTIGDAVAAVTAGADFLVTPCWVDGVAELGTQYGLPSIIGAATPSEILAARRARASVVKVFPAASLGGPAYIKNVRAVFVEVPLLVTGGVTVETAADYLRAGAVAVGLGSDLVPSAMVAAGDKAGVLARIAQVRASLGAV